MPITQAQIQAIIDGAFAFLEGKSQRPIVKTIEQMANTTLDAEMPAIYAYLQSIGVVKAA